MSLNREINQLRFVILEMTLSILKSFKDNMITISICLFAFYLLVSYLCVPEINQALQIENKVLKDKLRKANSSIMEANYIRKQDSLRLYGRK